MNDNGIVQERVIIVGIHLLNIMLRLVINAEKQYVQFRFKKKLQFIF